MFFLLKSYASGVIFFIFGAIILQIIFYNNSYSRSLSPSFVYYLSKSNEMKKAFPTFTTLCSKNMAKLSLEGSASATVLFRHQPTLLQATFVHTYINTYICMYASMYENTHLNSFSYMAVWLWI